MKKYIYYSSCIDCGTRCSRDAKRCSSCADKRHSIRMTGKYNSNFGNHKLAKEKNPSYKYNISKEYLEKYYIKQNLSQAQIAKILNCSVMVIYLRLKWYGIKIKTLKEVLKGKRLGENNGNWLGGSSYELYSFEFNNALKERIKQRDNYQCQICHVHEEDCKKELFIHHIDYNKQNSSEENLISLCNSCHSKTNGNREYWTIYFKSVIERIYSCLHMSR